MGSTVSTTDREDEEKLRRADKIVKTEKIPSLYRSHGEMVMESMQGRV